VGDIRPSILILFAAVVLVLLIACDCTWASRYLASAVNQTRILVGDSESFTLKWRRRAGLV
jgi:hypothetical protein